ncbi:kelch-like protein 10 [Rhipicephalus microplus]|uniref:kelch-like protein 10 n=1 Tax=Rhipicephalus microplus TaxID=6941 RepID=UPI003F6D437C
MCAPVAAEMKDSTVNGADNKDDMLTASFQATQLFTDDGRQREFTPAAAARAMPGLREQRKTRQFCDVLFRATNGPEVWAHRFVMCAKYSSCYTLFAIAKEAMAPEQRKEVGCPPVRALIEDLEGDMIELLVDFAYLIPMHERIGTHNIVRVLELAEKLKLIQIRDHCLKTLKQNLEPENCIQTYHLATSCGYEYLAGEALRYLIRSFDAVWKSNAHFEALTPEEMQSILEDDRLNAPSEVDETFKAILKWISADAATRKEYLAKFLPLVRFVRCSVTEFEKVLSYPQVQGDQSSLKVLTVIHKTLTRPSMEVGNVAGIDLSSKQWLRPRIPKDILFVFGGWTSGATNSMHTFNSRAQKWRVMGSQYTPPRATSTPWEVSTGGRGPRPWSVTTSRRTSGPWWRTWSRCAAMPAPHLLTAASTSLAASRVWRFWTASSLTTHRPTLGPGSSPCHLHAAVLRWSPTRTCCTSSEATMVSHDFPVWSNSMSGELAQPSYPACSKQKATSPPSSLMAAFTPSAVSMASRRFS